MYCDPSRAGLVLCAWGVHGKLYSRGAIVAWMLTHLGVKLHVLGLTKEGFPKHTLYLSASLKPVEWTP